MEMYSVNISEAITSAVVYMYFVALSGGLGLLTAAAIGYKLYKRAERKGNNASGKKKRGNVNGAI